MFLFFGGFCSVIFFLMMDFDLFCVMFLISAPLFLLRVSFLNQRAGIIVINGFCIVYIARINIILFVKR